MLALVLLGLVVCGPPASAVELKITRWKPATGPGAAQEVKVYKLENDPGRPYEILGVVSVVGNRLSARSGKTLKQMQAAAATLGAEALVGYYYDDEINTTTEAWAGALAVTFLADGSAAPRPPAGCVVVVPHFTAPEDLAKSKKARRTEDSARKWARFILARKGYYAFLVDDLYPAVAGAGLHDLPQEKLLRFGRAEADRVLELRFLSKTGVSVGLLNAEDITVAASLHSKTGGAAATWSSAGVGSSVVGGIADAFVPSAKTIESMRWGLEATFKPLPDISAPLSR